MSKTETEPRRPVTLSLEGRAYVRPTDDGQYELVWRRARGREESGGTYRTVFRAIDAYRAATDTE